MSVDDLFPRAPSTPDQVLGPRSARKPVVGPPGYRGGPPGPPRPGGPARSGRGAGIAAVIVAVIALGVVAGAVFIVGSAVRGVSRQVGVTGGPIGPPGVFPTVTAVTPVDAGGRIIVEQAAHRSAVILSEHPNAAERRATAQTFRAPGSGLVLGEAAVFALGRPDRVTVSLYEVHGDGPTDGTKLRARTVSIHGPLGPGYLVVRFDEPVEVRPGRVYALVVAPAGPGELLVGRVPNDDLYEGGRPWELGPGGWRAVAGELTFRLTFWLAGPVAVPLPSPTS